MAGKVELRNTSGLTFREVDGETFRRYTYPDGVTVTVDRVRYLSVADDHAHYLLDEGGRAHYIRPGWRHLEWNVGKGSPHFSVGRRIGA